MTYGGASLGSVSLGGLSASRSGTFFSPTESLAIGTHRRTLEYTGPASFFEVKTLCENFPTEPTRILRIYSHNDPGETPQLQTTVGVDAFFTQSIVGAARFMVAELEILQTISQIDITITGNEYFQ